MAQEQSQKKRPVDEWDLPVATTDLRTQKEYALINAAEKALYKRFYAHMSAVRDNITSLLCIEQALLDGDIEAAQEAFNELDEEAQIVVNLAPTKGGWFTTEERKLLRGG